MIERKSIHVWKKIEPGDLTTWFALLVEKPGFLSFYPT